MTPNISELVERLEGAARAATPHRWTELHNMKGPMGVVSEGGTAICHLAIHGGEHDNAAFIALANPENILALCATLKALAAMDGSRPAQEPVVPTEPVSTPVLVCKNCGTVARCGCSDHDGTPPVWAELHAPTEPEDGPEVVL